MSSCRKVKTVSGFTKYHYDPCTTTFAKYQDVKFLAGPEHLRNVYHYFHYRRPEDVGFVKCLFETNVYNYSHYDHCENVYFHLHRFELVSPQKCMLRRYNSREDRRMHVLYEMLVFAP